MFQPQACETRASLKLCHWAFNSHDAHTNTHFYTHVHTHIHPYTLAKDKGSHSNMCPLLGLHCTAEQQALNIMQHVAVNTQNSSIYRCYYKL